MGTVPMGTVPILSAVPILPMANQLSKSGLKAFTFGKEICQDIDRAIRKEWLLTNGLGGYASSTIAQANTRSYHGLLVASLKPPIRRFLILSSLEESIAIEDRESKLSTHFYKGPVVTDGYSRLLSFRLNPHPVWTFECEDVVIEKTLLMPYGENAVLVSYKVLQAAGPFRLIVKPLTGYRFIHQLSTENDRLQHRVETGKGSIVFSPYDDFPPLYVSHDAAIVDKSGYWYKQFDYPEESRRGLSSKEDLYSPFTLIYSLNGKREAFFYASLHPVEKISVEDMFKSRNERIHQLIPKKLEQNKSHLGWLHLAAHQFLVRKKDKGYGVIAGYPWFNEWGRDTMIAFHGLTLTTGQYNEAKAILLSAKDSIQHGVLPAYVAEEDGQPSYDTVDTSLWFVNACYRYLQYTEDYETIEKELYPKICQTLKLYQRGIPPHISLDRDGLIRAGSVQCPMTWMDVKLGGEAVTARAGKAVEVNALWYNALCIAQFLADYFKLRDDKTFFGKLARETYISFNKLFWSDELGYLYDVVDKNVQDVSLRPNQLIAMGLPFHVLEENDAKWKSILDKFEAELLTPCGLRSLSNRDKEYRGTYTGNQKQRDLAYHQGTVWPWFLGFYVSTYLKVYGLDEAAKEKMRKFLDDFVKRHLPDGCLGSISEIFDGDSPHLPKGCFAQAWSVGEVLRAYEELGDRLFEGTEQARQFTLR